MDVVIFIVLGCAIAAGGLFIASRPTKQPNNKDGGHLTPLA